MFDKSIENNGFLEGR